MKPPGLVFPDALEIVRSAEVSECGQYRWWLKRSWTGGDGRNVCFVMLNPSTADADKDDPTIRRCIGFVRAWGCSSLTVRNLFPFRATDPTELSKAKDPTGGARGDAELINATSADLVVAAWGANPASSFRVRRAMQLLAGCTLWCLGSTKEGFPRHPLYVPSCTKLVRYPKEVIEL